MDIQKNSCTDEITLVVSPKSPNTRWVALDNINNSILSEGKTPSEAIEKAKESTNDFTLMFVPKEDNSYFL